MKNISRLLGALLLPSRAIAQNSTSTSNTTTTDSSTEGLLSSGNVDMGAWADAYAKAVALVAQLTNEEKVAVMTGGSVSSVNWTALEFKDGTQGVQGKLNSFSKIWSSTAKVFKSLMLQPLNLSAEHHGVEDSWRLLDRILT